nr:hypothetical protein [Tanacetum cinerariifolium]
TVVRPATTVVPNISVTRRRQDTPIVTNPNSPTRWHINQSPSPKASNSPLRVTAVKALMVNVVQGNMSYLSDFEELNGDMFPLEVTQRVMCDKKNSVLFTDTECLVLSPEFKPPVESQVL